MDIIMLIGYNQATAMKRSTLELDLKFVEKYGYDFIEIRIDKLDEYLKNHKVNELKAFFSFNKIKPYALNALEYFNLNSKIEFENKKEEFKRMCKLCQAIGCAVIIAAPSCKLDNMKVEDINNNTIVCLHELAEIAGYYNLNVALEFIGMQEYSVNNLLQCINLVNEVDRSNVGMVFDCFHFYASDSNLGDLEKIDIKKIFSLHINDSMDLPKLSLTDSNRLFPGDGVIQLNQILNYFRMKYYNGAAIVELFNQEYWEWDVEELIRVAKQKTEMVCRQVRNTQTEG